MIVSSQRAPAEPICTIKEQALPPVASAKCLGYWWSWDLSANKSIDTAIGRARSSFFAFGAMGGFQGKLNPLSGRVIFETCVVPVLLFGSENWYLTESLLDKLEPFQAEIGRRILKLPRHHSGRATRLALEWPSMTARILQRKLLFIQRASTNEESLGHLFLTHLMGDTPSEVPLQIVEGSQFHESCLGLDGLVKKTLGMMCSIAELKSEVTNRDMELLLSSCQEHMSTRIAAAVAKESSWIKLWDAALDRGTAGTTALQNLYRELTRPSYGSSPCPRCDVSDLEGNSYFEHYITTHSSLMNVDRILSALSSPEPDLSLVINHFMLHLSCLPQSLDILFSPFILHMPFGLYIAKID